MAKEDVKCGRQKYKNSRRGSVVELEHPLVYYQLNDQIIKLVGT